MFYLVRVCLALTKHAWPSLNIGRYIKTKMVSLVKLNCLPLHHQVQWSPRTVSYPTGMMPQFSMGWPGFESSHLLSCMCEFILLAHVSSYYLTCELSASCMCELLLLKCVSCLPLARYLLCASFLGPSPLVGIPKNTGKSTVIPWLVPSPADWILS